jgi:antitoxin VapB
MAVLNVNPEMDELVEQLVATTGETADVAVSVAVRERLDRVTHRKGRELLERIRPILNRVAALPEFDPRPADEILGYNENGLFD